MESGKGLDAVEYLDRFFEELRSEVRANPAFANRLVKALGGQVVFDESRKGDILNPLVVAASETEDGFRRLFAGMSSSELRRMLKDYNLATAVDWRGLKQPALLELLIRRARDKVAERHSYRPS